MGLGLDSALSIASGGLDAINRQFALTSHNIANAGTAGYVKQIESTEAFSAEGVGLGVRSGIATRVLDSSVQADLLKQTGTVAGLDVQQAALAAVDTAQGTPGDGTDLASLTGTLRDGFSFLLTDPSNQVAQSQVVNDASSLVQAVGTLNSTISTQRQNAQDGLVADVAALNQALSQIGTLSEGIVSAKATGQSTADLETQRDAQIQTVAELTGAQSVEQPNGDVQLIASQGLILPTCGDAPFATSPASLGPDSAYPNTIPAITLSGTDVTTSLTGGRMGAEIRLRDTTLAAYKAQLDSFVSTVANRFSSQGLTLFTDGAGNLPITADTFTINPDVAITPSLVRDGTPTNANPSGVAGYTGVISAVLNSTFAAQTTPNPASGAAPWDSQATLTDMASGMAAQVAQDSSNASSNYSTEQDVQTSLTSKFSATSGVSIDAEMSSMVQLQNAYSANARLISAVQSMWTQLLNAVQ